MYHFSIFYQTKNKRMSVHHFIKINNEDIGLTFGLPHLQMLQIKLQQYPELLDGTVWSSVGYSYILYYSYKNHCMIKDLKPELSIEFFMNYVEHVLATPDEQSELLETVKVWTASRLPPKKDDEVQEDDKKKQKAKKK